MSGLFGNLGGLFRGLGGDVSSFTSFLSHPLESIVLLVGGIMLFVTVLKIIDSP